jgi:hypothetical protein
MIKELSEEAKAFLKCIIEQLTCYRIEKVEGGGYQVIGVRRGKIVWKSCVVSSLHEAQRIVAQMIDVGV